MHEQVGVEREYTEQEEPWDQPPTRGQCNQSLQCDPEKEDINTAEKHHVLGSHQAHQRVLDQEIKGLVGREGIPLDHSSPRGVVGRASGRKDIAAIDYPHPQALVRADPFQVDHQRIDRHDNEACQRQDDAGGGCFGRKRHLEELGVQVANFRTGCGQ